MKIDLLYKIADIINGNSRHYRAIVPTSKRDYMVYQRGKLVRSSCFVLRIMALDKAGATRSVWNIYEKDIDKIIAKVCRRDSAFANRIEQCEPTTRDVEMLIRRASFISLRLKIADPLLYMYVSDDD